MTSSSEANASEPWYWAARRSGPAGDAFVIAKGQDALWSRVRAEIDPNGKAAWAALPAGTARPNVGDILLLLLSVVQTYRVNHNRFVFEAARVPCFAQFLRDAPIALPNFVSNSMYPDAPMVLEPYSPQAAAKLGSIVSATLGIDEDWVDF